MFREIGPKFAKLGDTSLTLLAKNITAHSEDLSPSVSKQSEAILDSDKISLFTLNNSKVYVYSQKAAGLNLYRILNYIKPERILMQIRPDDLDHRNPSPEVAPQRLIPSVKMYTDLTSALKESGFFLSTSRYPGITGTAGMHYDRISGLTCAIAGIWAMQHSVLAISLSDIPRKAYYRMLTSSITLMQLQSMFSHIGKLMGAQPDSISIDEPNLPVVLGYKLYPHIWDVHSVNYLAKEITEGTMKYKKILCIAARDTGQRLEKVLEEGVPQVNYARSLYHTSIVRKDCSEMVMEKVAVIDVLAFGLELWERIAEDEAMERVDEFIKELVEEERVESKYTLSMQDVVDRRDFLQKLYLSMLRRYSTFGSQKISDGKEKLKIEFLKQMLRS